MSPLIHSLSDDQNTLSSPRPSIKYCLLLDVIVMYAPSHRFDVNAADVVRHLLPDIVVLITSLLSLLLITLISLTQMWQKSSLNNKELGSSGKHKDVQKSESIDMGSYQSISPKPTLQDASSKHSSKSSIHSVNIEKQLEKSQRSSFLLMPPKQTFSYITTAWNFTVVFLLWLSGVCVASVLNFPYFVGSIYLSLCWALRLNHTRLFVISQRIVTMLVTLYSAVHLIVLYLYQFQSAQDLVPRPSISARYSIYVYATNMYYWLQNVLHFVRLSCCHDSFF